MTNSISSTAVRIAAQLAAKLRPPKKYQRSQLIDVLRGCGILMMVVFHFFYDLTIFGLAEIPIYSSSEWIAFRFIILTSFLATAGASLYLHYQRGINYRAFWRRIAFVAGCAWVISLVTYITLAEKYVFFGILHLIALSSVIGLLFVRLYWINLLLGLAILYLGYNYDNAVFNNFGLRWIGMLTVATGSSDFTPIFPYFGLVLLGIWAARFLGDAIYLQREGSSRLAEGLATMGRYSLIIYMTHQPILWGLIYLYIFVSG